MSGYDEWEVLGRNPRFLQGPETAAADRAALAAFVANPRQDRQVTMIRNYRKSGEAFDDLLFLHRLRGPDGQPAMLMGVQFDVSTLPAAWQPTRRPEEINAILRQTGDVSRLNGHRALVSTQAVTRSLASMAAAALFLSEGDGFRTALEPPGPTAATGAECGP